MGKFLKVFINDFNIHNMAWEEHLKHIWFVLLKLKEVIWSSILANVNML
jgi:hypothetical protein